jgi:hypothetical protein
VEISPEIQELLDKQKEELSAKFEADTEGLKKSQQALLSEKKAAQEEKERIAAEAEKARLDKAAKDKDVETLSQSYQEKLEQLRKENERLTNGIKQGKITELASGFVNANVVDDAFSRQAMQDVYAKRLDIREGKPVVLDAQGNLTALSVEDLNREIMSSSIYANHIKSGEATGGGAAGGRSNGGGAVVANINGSLSEKAGALASKIEGFNSLPIK